MYVMFKFWIPGIDSVKKEISGGEISNEFCVRGV